MTEETKKEIEYYKTKSDFKIKMYILIYKTLMLLNNKWVYFCTSLIPMLFIGCFIFNVPFIFLMLVHFLSWKFITSFKNFSMESVEEDNVEFSIIIKSLSEHIKNKKGVN